MTQDTEYQFANNSYPPRIGTGNSILQDSDIVNFKILNFYRGILQANLAARWQTECTACGMTNANIPSVLDGYIVGDAICYPVPTTLKQTDYRFPLLSVYRRDENYKQLSTHHIVTESNFVITWTMPPLSSPAKQNHLYPFLNLVSKTLLFYTFEGNDPKYNSGELVWQEAGFAFALMESAKFGSFLGQDGTTVFPSIQIQFKVYERNNTVPGNFETFTGFDGYVSETDLSSINNPVTDFLRFTANPGLQLGAFAPAAGSIQGNQMVLIHGTGFESAGFSQPSQITIAGNSVIRFLVKSDTTMIVITGPTVSGASGPVAITDNKGNVATSSQLYTYS